MKDKTGEIIYVGKATSLKERVRSYFGGGLLLKTEVQMQNVVEIDYIESDSPLEALILETSLIKRYTPKFNIREKDDKSSAYVHFTKETYPRIHILRATDLQIIREKNPILYGPFSSTRAIYEALEVIRKVVPFRTCVKMPKKKCLYGYLGLCEAPCENMISEIDYRQRIRNVRDFFEGKKARVLKNLEREMTTASKNLEFEKAKTIRDRLFSLEHLKRIFILHQDIKTIIFNRIEGYDISNISGLYATGSMVVFIDGMSEKSEYRKFKIQAKPGAGDVAMLKEMLERRFKRVGDGGWPLPDLILIDGGRGQVNVAVEVLKKANLDIPVVGLAKGPDRKKDELITSRTMPRQEILLLKEVRDEAHRFAKGYYEKLHRKSMI